MRSTMLLLLILFVACGQRAEVETRTDPYGSGPDDDPQHARSVTFRGEDAFQRADRLVREGDYDGAISTYRTLYRDEPASDDRARALYEWARAEGHLLNPDRDLDAAVARLELLLEEFPDAAIAFRAREELARLRTFQGQSGRPRD